MATFPCQQWVSLFLVIFANIGMRLVLTCATKTIPNEMGGEFSGQVYAVTNTFSNMAGVVGKTRNTRTLSSLPAQFRTLYTWLFSRSRPHASNNNVVPRICNSSWKSHHWIGDNVFWKLWSFKAGLRIFSLFLIPRQPAVGKLKFWI